MNYTNLPILISGDLEMVKVLIEDGKAQTDTLIAELFEQEILNDPQYQGIQNYLEQRRILNKETKDKCTIQ